MIILRRVGILKELIADFALTLSVSFIPSEGNRADALTRVRKRWVKMLDEPGESMVTTCCTAYNEVKEHHSMHHMGIDRTLYLVRKVDPTVSRETVKRVVR